MKHRIIFLVILSTLFTGCHKDNMVKGIYRYYCGERNGYHIWIVDGSRVRSKIYDSFLYGGNDQRYLFNPQGEIWIDNAISCEEFELTLAHEMNERHLMATFGWTYYKAHDSSLRVELRMRHEYESACRTHEEILPLLPVTDYSGTKEIRNIPDSVRLRHIYRIPLGKRNGISIWVVDGYRVRKEIYPDFGFSSNDLSCHFIPTREIWIDGQISCEETEYSIETELVIRELMMKGKSYSNAYTAAIDKIDKRRTMMECLVHHHLPVTVPEILARDTGVIVPDAQ